MRPERPKDREPLSSVSVVRMPTARVVEMSYRTVDVQGQRDREHLKAWPDRFSPHAPPRVARWAGQPATSHVAISKPKSLG
jgi:hypothetical protein